jgi:riboflavin kinase/FMN adenylyltransferase
VLGEVDHLAVADAEPLVFHAGALRALRTPVVVGANYRFGHQGAGDAALLRELGARHGFTADAPCSSTLVRALLRGSDIRGATRVLGHPHHVDGAVVYRALVPAPGTAVPAPGRYAVRLTCGKRLDADGTADGRVLVDADAVEFLERR